MDLMQYCALPQLYSILLIIYNFILFSYAFQHLKSGLMCFKARDQSFTLALSEDKIKKVLLDNSIDAEFMIKILWKLMKLKALLALHHKILS